MQSYAADMSELALADANHQPLTFEDFKKENGMVYWWASDLMRMLGYKELKSFQNAIDRATKACITLNIPHYDNFLATTRVVDGEHQRDFKLTRFACYLTVMNADPKKPEVAAAQVYFAEQTRKFEILIQSSEEFERLLIRGEIKEGNKTLASVAKSAGVTDYARFNNAGYLGLYNMLNVDLARQRKIEPKELMDHMSRTELAANLFRITQTEERIKNFGVKGQRNLEQTHHEVGREVRGIIQKNTGRSPEQLPPQKKISEFQKQLKKGQRKMALEDRVGKK
jgi:DNA-damage-inducible protein D